MAKQKTTAEKAAEAAAREQAAPSKENNAAGLDTNHNPNTKGLTQGEKVQYVASLQTERAYIMNSENPSKAMIDGISLLAQATILDIGIGEIATGSSAVGCIVTANQKNYETFRAIGNELGIKLPEFKALPQPTEDQLKAAGIVGLLPSETRVVTMKKEDVSQDAINKKKKEIAAETKAVTNPAEIKNDEQLKNSLSALLTKPISDGVDRPDARLQRTIDFYRGYLTIQANHEEDKKAALDKVKAMSRIDMLNNISEIVGPCPFALSGTAKFLRNFTNETDSPISAYCLYRRTAVPSKDGSLDDQYLADVVRSLIIWSCKSQITECENVIAMQEKAITKEKGSAKVATETAIRVNKQKIEELQHIIEIVTNPSTVLADNLIDNYKSENQESVEYKLAHRIVSDIMKTYYPEFMEEPLKKDGKVIDEDVMLKNVQQRAGIIINMFRGSLSQSIAYKEANLTDMATKDAPKEETKVEEPEDESKN